MLIGAREDGRASVKTEGSQSDVDSASEVDGHPAAADSILMIDDRCWLASLPRFLAMRDILRLSSVAGRLGHGVSLVCSIYAALLDHEPCGPRRFDSHTSG